MDVIIPLHPATLNVWKPCFKRKTLHSVDFATMIKSTSSYPGLSQPQMRILIQGKLSSCLLSSKASLPPASVRLVQVCLFFCLISANLLQANPQTLVVRYPAADHVKTYTNRVNYFVEILDLALKKSGRAYRLEKITTPLLLENRSKNNLKHKIYDVHWMNAKEALESDLRPVPVPLCKGLTGWRILFIRPENQPDFSKINSLKDLNHFTAIHGHDWPEKYIYEDNHLKQKLTNNFKSLFLMLHRKRGDYLSRSLLEIFEEEHAFPQLNVAIETDLILHYPAAYYFYVAKNNQELAHTIEAGLKAAIADGSFDEIFNRYFLEQIERGNLSRRRIIEIPFFNTYRIDQSNPAFWYKPKEPDNLQILLPK